VPFVFRDKGTSGTQIDVRSGSISVGHIGKEMFSEMAGGSPRWRWYLKIDHDAAPKGFVRDGYVDGLEQARASIEHNWQTWLKAAGLKER
jgi:hypothetical protein